MNSHEDTKTRSGLKRSDIRPCGLCGKGIMSVGSPTFFRVKIERFVVDTGAVHRQAGLETMLGTALANVLGPDADLANQFSEQTALICDQCAMETTCLARVAEEIWEKAGKPMSREGAKEAKG